jgi:hypothetical protein
LATDAIGVTQGIENTRMSERQPEAGLQIERALEAAWVSNRGAACTTAALLAALGALGARDLPELGAACEALGAAPFGAPRLRDYLALPGRPAPLDRRVERLAEAAGIRVSCRTRICPLGRIPRPGPGRLVVANLAWGQERPGHFGTWGWHPLRVGTYAAGGHSVVVAEQRDGWVVLDPNYRGLQRWPRPGWVITATVVERLGPRPQPAPR